MRNHHQHALLSHAFIGVTICSMLAHSPGYAAVVRGSVPAPFPPIGNRHHMTGHNGVLTLSPEDFAKAVSFVNNNSHFGTTKNMTPILPPLPIHEFELPEVLPFWVWEILFRKAYEPNERKQRRQIFNKNVKLMIEHNLNASMGLAQFRMGINQFSDLTSSEFKALLGYKPGTSILPSVSVTNSHVTNRSLLPDSVDWRAKGAVTPIKNQGTCGSCYAFATVGAIEGSYAIQTGALRVLSEQQIVDCSQHDGNQGCDGGDMDNSFRYVLGRGGLDSETDYKYQGKTMTCDNIEASRHVANIVTYKALQPPNEGSLAEATASSPVAVAVEANKPMFQNYRSGILNGDCGQNVNHGMTVVGYAEDYWIVKNSWGKSWGEAGYVRMKRNVDGPVGLCGIAVEPYIAIVSKGPPMPLPPPTPPHPPPPPTTEPPCPGCTGDCVTVCQNMGMHCCGPSSKGCSCNKGDTCCSANATVSL